MDTPATIAAAKPKTVRVTARTPRVSGLVADVPERLREEAEEAVRRATAKPTPPEAPSPKRDPLKPVTRSAWAVLLLRLRCWRRATENGCAEFTRAPREIRKERDAACAACSFRSEKPGCPRVRCRLKGCGCDDLHTVLLASKCPKKTWAR